MSDDYDRPSGEGEVLVFRGPTGRPVAVPDEIVSEAEREYRAYTARLSGQSWAEIAVNEQWPSAEAAAAAVKRYLAEGKAVVGDLRRREALAMEMARLDALQSALWPQAMKGNVAHVGMALQVVNARVKLLGLEQATEEEAGAAETVVVPSDEGYLAALQRAASGG